MDKLKEISFKEEKAIFDRLEKMASRANLTKEERAQYEREWKIYTDYYSTIKSAEKKARMETEEARAKGLAEGRAEGRAEGFAQGEAKAKSELARNLKTMGIAPDTIAQATGLSIEEIEKL